MVITSKSNPLVKLVSSLADKKFRRLHGLYIVEGIKPVRECILAGCAVEEIVCTEERSQEFANARIVSEAVFRSITTEVTPQGVLALVRIPKNEIIAPKGRCILLDNLQDPGNLGTVIRTANAAGYEDIYLVNCTDSYSPKCVRASMGGIFFVNIRSGSLESVLSALGDIPLICADMGGEDIFSFCPPEKFCLCIGNEGSGLSSGVYAHSSHTVSIPMRNTCESLNAAVSAGIAMYALKNNIKR